MRYALFGLILFLSACDAATDAPPCTLLTDDTFTFSAPFTANSGEAIALFEFQQEVRTYETDNCAQTDPDVNEVSLVVRNLTACVVNLTYSTSLISNGEGFTHEGTATIQPGAALDQGIVERNSPIIISNAQAVVTGTSTLTACP